MIEPKKLEKIIVWKVNSNTYFYKLEKNVLMFSMLYENNSDRQVLCLDEDAWNEVDMKLVGDEINYKPIIKALKEKA